MSDSTANSTVLPERPLLSPQNGAPSLHNTVGGDLQRHYARVARAQPMLGPAFVSRYQRIGAQQRSLARAIQRRFSPTGATVSDPALVLRFIRRRPATDRAHTILVPAQPLVESQPHAPTLAGAVGPKQVDEQPPRTSPLTVAARQGTAQPSAAVQRRANPAVARTDVAPQSVQLMHVADRTGDLTALARQDRSGVDQQPVQRNLVARALRRDETTPVVRQVSAQPTRSDRPTATNITHALATALLQPQQDHSAVNQPIGQDAAVYAQSLQPSAMPVMARQATARPDIGESSPIRTAVTQPVVAPSVVASSVVAPTITVPSGVAPTIIAPTIITPTIIAPTSVQNVLSKAEIAHDLAPANSQPQLARTMADRQARQGTVRSRIPRISETTVVARQGREQAPTSEHQSTQPASPQALSTPSPVPRSNVAGASGGDLATFVPPQSDHPVANRQPAAVGVQEHISGHAMTAVARPATERLASGERLSVQPVLAQAIGASALTPASLPNKGVVDDLGAAFVQPAPERSVLSRQATQASGRSRIPRISEMTVVPRQATAQPDGGKRGEPSSAHPIVAPSVVPSTVVAPASLSGTRLDAAAVGVPEGTHGQPAPGDAPLSAIQRRGSVDEDDPQAADRASWAVRRLDTPGRGRPMRIAEPLTMPQSVRALPLQAAFAGRDSAGDLGTAPVQRYVTVVSTSPEQHHLNAGANATAIPVVTAQRATQNAPAMAVGHQHFADNLVLLSGEAHDAYDEQALLSPLPDTLVTNRGPERSTASARDIAEDNPIDRAALLTMRKRVPVLPVNAPVATMVAQRTLAARQGAGATMRTSGVTQPTNGQGTTTSSTAPAQELDVERLATAVYQIIEQRLVIERESLGL